MQGVDRHEHIQVVCHWLLGCVCAHSHCHSTCAANDVSLVHALVSICVYVLLLQCRMWSARMWMCGEFIYSQRSAKHSTLHLSFWTSLMKLLKCSGAATLVAAHILCSTQDWMSPRQPAVQIQACFCVGCAYFHVWGAVKYNVCRYVSQMPMVEMSFCVPALWYNPVWLCSGLVIFMNSKNCLACIAL